MTSARTPKRRVLPHSPFKKASVGDSPTESFAINDRVSHDRHGMGTVVRLYGETEIAVDFGSEVRRIAIPNPKIVKL